MAWTARVRDVAEFPDGDAVMAAAESTRMLRAMAERQSRQTLALRRRVARTQRGYALIAALIAVAIVGFAATVAVERSQLDAQRERERELLFIGEQFRAALKSYYAVRAAGPQVFPKSLDDLVQDDRQLVTVRHLRRIYRDPMTGEADWVLDRSGDRIIAVHSRSRGAPLKHAGFSPLEGGFRDAKTYADWRFSGEATDANAVPQAGTASPLGGLPASADSSSTNAPQGASSLANDQVFRNNQCFQLYVAPQADCTDVPPPFGRDQASCIQYLAEQNTACLASGVSAP